MDDIMNAELTDILPVSGGGGLQSIGPGMYLFTMPDGRQITFNDAGEITNIQ